MSLTLEYIGNRQHRWTCKSCGFTEDTSIEVNIVDHECSGETKYDYHPVNYVHKPTWKVIAFPRPEALLWGCDSCKWTVETGRYDKVTLHECGGRQKLLSEVLGPFYAERGVEAWKEFYANDPFPQACPERRYMWLRRMQKSLGLTNLQVEQFKAAVDWQS